MIRNYLPGRMATPAAAPAGREGGAGPISRARGEAPRKTPGPLSFRVRALTVAPLRGLPLGGRDARGRPGRAGVGGRAHAGR